MTPPLLHRDPFLLALALLALLQAGFVAAHLVYPDLNLDYPFMDGDSHDWIANGLRMAGHDVRFSGRAPLLPLMVAALEKVSALPWLPVLLQILFHGTVLAFYTLAVRLCSRPAAFAAALALLVNHSLLGMSLQVMADVPASCLIFLGTRSFLLARYPAAGLLGGLGALTQPIGLIAAVPAALTVLLQRRAHLRSFRLWLGGSLLIGLPILWMAVQGTGEADIPSRQWDLVALHAGSVPFYGWTLLSLLGLPACLLLAAGLLRRTGDAHLSIVLFFGTLTGFFVFLYTYDAKRFLVYPVWMAGLLIAGALARLPRPAFATAAVLLVAGSGMPLPGEPADPSWAALSPLPPVYGRVNLDATPTGGQALASWEVDLTMRSGGELNLMRVRQARTSFVPTPHPDPGIFEQDRSVLFLYERPSDGGGRYRTITRLGNALRKRVKYVPRSWLDPWWSRIGLTPLGEIEKNPIYRARLPGSGATWVVVTSAPPSWFPPSTNPPPYREEGRFGGAEVIHDHLRGWDGYVALVPGEGSPKAWQLYLPFLVETTELYVPEPGQERQILEIFDAAPNLGEEAIGSVVVRRTELLGRKASLVRGTAEPPR